MSSLLEAIARVDWRLSEKLGSAKYDAIALLRITGTQPCPSTPFEILTIRVDYQLAAQLTP